MDCPNEDARLFIKERWKIELEVDEIRAAREVAGMAPAAVEPNERHAALRGCLEAHDDGRLAVVSVKSGGQNAVPVSAVVDAVSGKGAQVFVFSTHERFVGDPRSSAPPKSQGRRSLSSCPPGPSFSRLESPTGSS